MNRHLKIYRVGSRPGIRRLERLADRGRDVVDPKTVRAAEKIVRRVRKGGDKALLDHVRRLDGYGASSVAELELTHGAGLAGPPSPEGLPKGFAEALEHAVAAVERYHRPQVRKGYRLEGDGVFLEELVTPLSRVGLYVPGGRASYPSTVVMTVIPARLAGVPEIVVATPPEPYRSNPALRYTLDRLGVHEIWGMGGAHAVAALAYGTETIRRVDLVAGPGNAWVAAAKALVAGDVKIDTVAGPSEVVVVAEGAAVADAGAIDRLAADLLAQAEHDPRAAAVLVTDDRRVAKRVSRRVEERLKDLPTAKTASESLSAFGAAFVVGSMAEAADVVERLAPEHLQLVGPGAEALVEPGDGRRPLPAGAIFLGASTPEVFGDYVAGPNHVLPTCGTARFASALGVEDFVRRSHRVRYTEEAARRAAPAAVALAEVEGLPAHAASARLRLGEGRGEEGGAE